MLRPVSLDLLLLSIAFLVSGESQRTGLYWGLVILSNHVAEIGCFVVGRVLHFQAVAHSSYMYPAVLTLVSLGYRCSSACIVIR